MKSRFLPCAVLVPAVCICATVPVFAGRQSVPIVNLEKETWTPLDGKVPSLEQVKKAIIKGGRRSGYPWLPETSSEGKLTLTTLVRGKHRVWVDIEFSATDFSIRYKNSENLNYEKKSDGRELIHPFFARWIRELADNAEIELAAIGE